jgi:uncharacterized repeat protein (TIGR03843 family)
VRADQRVSELTHGRDDRTWAAGPPIGTPDALALLREGELEVIGRVRDASNVVLYCEIRPEASDSTDAGAEDTEAPSFHVAYKPIRGERPLDDFPLGTLAAREEAAWWVSQELGWGIVPPTIVRDGPAGPGAVQLWIDTDDQVDVLRMILVRDERLRPMSVFDVLVNNADRKGGHLLVTEDSDVHGVDHGICFAAEPKLRTVLWGWRGEDIERVCAGLDRELGERLADLLSPREVDALRSRAQRLLADGRLPVPDPYAHIIPWPPF